MKNLLLLILVASSISIFAQSNLWKVTGNDLENPSYLFGTIHLLPKDKFEIKEKVKKAIAESEVLVTEISLDIPFKEQLALAAQMYLPNGTTYKDYTSEEDYNLIYTYLTDSLNIKEGKIKRIVRIKPFFASGILVKEHYGKIKSYEIELTKLAKKNKLDFGYLETIEDQLSLIEEGGTEDQFGNIVEEVTSIKEFDKMVDCYVAEDIECLYDIILDDDDEDFVKVFLDDRNEKWIPIMESKMVENATFFAFGAGHLLGEKGVIQLLKNKGYEVVPIK